MDLINSSSVADFLSVHGSALGALRSRLEDDVTNDLVDTWRSLIAEIETAFWAGDPDDALLAAYQAAFRHMEGLIAKQGKDQRHKFIITIPVADRPEHLKSCLESLLHLCRTFAYNRRKVAVIIADDSGNADNIRTNQEIAAHYQTQGIETHYFGLPEQLEQLDKLGAAERCALSDILGNTDREAFHHKGPSLMRNIAYLKLNEIAAAEEKILFYFIDSDQEFRVKISTAGGDKNLYAINYFYYLDRIFSETDTLILTGKVVGDPPVSPAVMAGNFLEDVSAFLHEIAALPPESPCRFHHGRQEHGGDASYHDMAALFGFKAAQTACQYRCTLRGEHDNARCFAHFASKLKRFFYGEHPTRKTYYQHQDTLDSVRPARTIYTGNYIFKPEALRYFIPFAPLKLRMAGPVLGRIIKSEIAAGFASANLPMLHKRTVRTTDKAEFRPGIVADTTTIDLSGEFERQFYGDVMLFTIEKLADMGYPARTLERVAIVAALEATHQHMETLYDQRHLAIREKLANLKTLVGNQECWWNHAPEYAAAMQQFTAFMNNIERNFGENAYAIIHAPSAKRHDEIIAAITRYADDRQAWDEMLANP